MKKTNSLSDLLMEELAELLDGENQLIEALPKMVQNSQSSALKAILENHLETTRIHANRLQDIFSNTGQQPQRTICKAMESFIAESKEVFDRTEYGPARDAAIISVAQRVEQYQITGYRMACEHAVELNHTRIIELLNETIDEERVMNLHLNELAQYTINVQAINPFNFSQPQQ